MGDSIFGRSYLPTPAGISVTLLIPDRCRHGESPPNQILAEVLRGKVGRPRAPDASNGSAPRRLHISAKRTTPISDTANRSGSRKPGAGRPRRLSAIGMPVDNPHCGGCDIPDENVAVSLCATTNRPCRPRRPCYAWCPRGARWCPSVPCTQAVSSLMVLHHCFLRSSGTLFFAMGCWNYQCKSLRGCWE